MANRKLTLEYPAGVPERYTNGKARGTHRQVLFPQEHYRKLQIPNYIGDPLVGRMWRAWISVPPEQQAHDWPPTFAQWAVYVGKAVGVTAEAKAEAG